MVVPVRGTNASLSPVRLRAARFDELCAAKGAHTEVARAELANVDRRTLYRWRDGERTPGLDVALLLAERLGTTVEDIWCLRHSSQAAKRAA
jgi:DNA-binding XRE family transcriptional regulator